MTPSETLTLAQDLLERADAKTAGLWPRAAALLARQALEESLDAYWTSKGLPLENCSMRPQLICLERFLDDPSLATGINHAWSALTNACHHHPYERPPISSELMHWIATTKRFVERAS